ncbi:hypothetical protein EJB00_01250 [Wolbachia endosymbiont of Drosophila mauritiana]|uniref:hypothetical protein n=1 Tax=unclassified Wolbachia TaxID=2640676 RepID=UPI00109C90BF|nr:MULTISPECIES: hypothetical protein [unclassified Wolbachia]QCB62305.1 hypothetical protein EJA99_01250 [Wolbachia endosymbiont of Drosophila mauritiana]QCB63352.1 hypothetical protein EJB00_01250 [Wolbachia endosymbiont of Drosophila mauritiana]QWE33387.1 Uncharacterized protein WwMa_04800 [Wolbachia endosymbiont of Drosophila simulans]
MVASLKFESAAGTAAATLTEVKLVTLADNTDNKYTLDITTDDLKVAYTPNGGQAKEYTVNGLAAALGKLLTIDGSTAGKSVLAEEVAKKPVVEALIPELAKDDGTTGIYTKKGVDNELAKKADTTALDNKADKSYVNTELANKADTSALADKADKSELAKKADTSALADKADKSELAKKADTTALDNKADKSYVNTELANKADTSALADKADKSELAKKADTTALDNKADKSYVNTELAKKANTADVYTKAEAENTFLKTTELKTKAAEKAVVEAIFDAKDGQKSILVEKLGLLLDSTETPYGAQSNQAAKTFLADKG